MPLDFKKFQARLGNNGFQVNNKSATKAEIVIYAAIGQDYWKDGSMVSAKAISDELKKLPDTVNEITVRLNSPGGDVFEGVAIYNRLKQHKAKIIVYIDGLAASIASIIALAGDEIYIGEGALFMIHLPWTFAMGDRMSLENTINRLMDVEEQLLGIYSKKTKMDKAELRKMLEDETWLDADQAIEHGFVDAKVEESVPIAASAIKATWISKRPETYTSEVSAVNDIKNKLKQKIEAKLARK
jgi:ATP-dependent Clp protease protease subunit